MSQNVVLEIIGEFTDKISPKLTELVEGNIPKLTAALAVLAAAWAVEKVVEFTKEALKAGDELGKLSQRAGVASEALGGLQVAARLGGVGTEQFGQALQQLNKKLVEAQDPISKTNQIFKALGIETKDAFGKIKSAQDVLAEMADSFEKSQDGVGKTTAAMELMGDAGTKMIPVLNEGSAKLREMAKLSQDLGFVWSKDQTKAAEEFNDSIETLKMAFEGLWQIIAKDLAPKLAEIGKYMAESVKEGGLLRAVLDGLAKLISGPVGAALDFLATIGGAIALAFQLVGKAIGGTAAALAAFASGDLKGAANIVGLMLDDMKQKTEEYMDFMDKIWNPDEHKAKTEEMKKDLGDLGLRAKQELEEFMNAKAGLMKELYSSETAGKTSEVIYETQFGSMRRLTQAHKEELIQIAREIDMTKMRINLAKELTNQREALKAKTDTTAFTVNAQINIDDPRTRAGYMAAKQQEITMEQKLNAMKDEALRNKDPQVRQNLLEQIEAMRKKYQVGGELYEQARQNGEYEYEALLRAKAFTEAIGNNTTQMKELTKVREYYDLMLKQGSITEEQYADLVKKNSRALEDLKNSTTEAGRAFQDVVNNRRGMEDTTVKMNALTQAFRDGKISSSEYRMNMANLQDQLDSLNPNFAVNQLRKMQDEMTRTAGAFEGMFSDYIFDAMQGKWSRLDVMVKNIIDRMVANMLAAQIQMALFGDMGSTPYGKTPTSTGLIGSFFSGLFGGFRADGGDVTPGKAYVVGERRPELFVPSVPGKILPSTGGTSGGSSVTMNITAMDSQDVMRVLSGKKREIADMVLNTSRNYNIK